MIVNSDLFWVVGFWVLVGILTPRILASLAIFRNPGRLRYPAMVIPPRMYARALAILLENGEIRPEPLRVELFTTPQIVRDVMMALYHRERDVLRTPSQVQGVSHLADLRWLDSRDPLKYGLEVEFASRCDEVRQFVGDQGKRLMAGEQIDRIRRDITAYLATHDCKGHKQTQGEETKAHRPLRIMVGGKVLASEQADDDERF